MLTGGGVMKKRSSPIKPRWRQAPLAVALQPLCQRWRRVYKTRHHQHPWHVFNYHFKAHGQLFLNKFIQGLYQFGPMIGHHGPFLIEPRWGFYDALAIRRDLA